MRSYLIETHDPGLVTAAKHHQFWNPMNEDVDIRESLCCLPLALVFQFIHEWYFIGKNIYLFQRHLTEQSKYLFRLWRIKLQFGCKIDPHRFHMRVNNDENPLSRLPPCVATKSRIIKETTEDWEVGIYEIEYGVQISPFYDTQAQIFEDWFNPDLEIEH